MIRVTTEGEPRRHQVTEIPEINPHTTEYPCPQVVCEHGQKTTQEPLPEEVRGNFGPHLTALIAYWTVVCRVPRRLVKPCRPMLWAWKVGWGAPRKLGGEAAKRAGHPGSEGTGHCPGE